MKVTKTYQCINDCPNEGKRWVVELTEIQPGLLQELEVLCTGCMTEPLITEMNVDEDYS